MIRRTAMEAVGWFRPAFAAAQAYDLWLRIAERFELAGLGRPVLYRRYHPGQLTFTKMVTQVTCSMAARAAARARHETGRDPLEGVAEFTPQVLEALGLGPEVLNRAIIQRGLAMAKHMVRAGYLDLAMSALDQTALRARIEPVHRHGLAKAGKVCATVRWRQGRPLQALAATMMAGGHYALLAAGRLLGRRRRAGTDAGQGDDADL
jgi:hypothetical protein